MLSHAIELVHAAYSSVGQNEGALKFRRRSKVSALFSNSNALLSSSLTNQLPNDRFHLPLDSQNTLNKEFDAYPRWRLETVTLEAVAVRPAVVEPMPVVKMDLGVSLLTHLRNCDFPVPFKKIKNMTGQFNLT